MRRIVLWKVITWQVSTNGGVWRSLYEFIRWTFCRILTGRYSRTNETCILSTPTPKAKLHRSWRRSLRHIDHSTLLNITMQLIIPMFIINGTNYEFYAQEWFALNVNGKCKLIRKWIKGNIMNRIQNCVWKIIILLNYNPFVKEMIFVSINVFNKKHGFQAWNRNVNDIYLFSTPRYYDLIYNCCLYFFVCLILT